MESPLSPDSKASTYHLVPPSPWPILAALSAFLVACGLVIGAHFKDWCVLILGLIALGAIASAWFWDIARESQTDHTPPVQHGLKIGMALFILSEVLLFMSFFGAFFDTSLKAAVWPPKGIVVIDPFRLPYLNTLLLLLSGTTLTWAHISLTQNHRKESLQGLQLTIGLGFLFLSIQVFEYLHAPFHFHDGIYPSIFFMSTGFHGAHVLIGALFLSVCWVRLKRGTLNASHHLGFEMATWYWHFVDVVWLLLFVCLYWWGSGTAITH